MKNPLKSVKSPLKLVKEVKEAEAEAKCARERLKEALDLLRRNGGKLTTATLAACAAAGTVYVTSR